MVLGTACSTVSMIEAKFGSSVVLHSFGSIPSSTLRPFGWTLEALRGGSTGKKRGGGKEHYFAKFYVLCCVVLSYYVERERHVCAQEHVMFPSFFFGGGETRPVPVLNFSASLNFLPFFFF